MRFFTALMACALVMSACSEAAFVPASDNPDLTRGGNGSHIGFKKVVQIADGEFRPASEDEFAFELYGVQKSNGKKAPKVDFFGTFTTDANGEVWVNFPDIKGGGRDSYYFREVFATPEEAAKWEELDDLLLTVKPSWGAEWDEYGNFDFNDGPTIVNIPIPEEEPVDGYQYSAPVTLTNNADDLLFVNKKNGKPHNNFCYAVLSREILEAGDEIKLDMIKPGTLDDKGDAFVKLEDGKLVIYVEDGELDTNTFEIYNGVWNNNGNTGVGLTIDYPAGEGDFRIHFWGHYSWN